MPPGQFFFAVHMSSDTSVPLLRDLVGRVCRAVCHVPERAEELTTVIADGVEQAAGPGCELRFEARGGTLAVTVWMGSECTWRATRSVS